jgi:hypothetical protein
VRTPSPVYRSRACPDDPRRRCEHDQTGTRYYDCDGNLTERVLNDVFPVNNPLNVIYNSVTGKSVGCWADDTATDEPAMPGDLGSATVRITGNLYTAMSPGAGLLPHDVVVFTFGPDGSALEDHGPKMGFFGDIDKLCPAVA